MAFLVAKEFKMSSSMRRIGYRFFCSSSGGEIPYEEAKPFDEIPGPRSLPFVGNEWRYKKYIGTFSLDKLHQTYMKMYRNYGPLVREVVSPKRMLVHVYDPEDMSTVYKSDGKFPNRQSHTAVARYRKERPDIYDSIGLGPGNGEEWYRFRSQFQNMFMRPEAEEWQRTTQALEEVTEDLLHRISSDLDSKQELNITPVLFNWALESVAAVALNTRLGCLSDEGNPESEGIVAAAHSINEGIFLTENKQEEFEKNYKLLESAEEHLERAVRKCMDKAVEQIEQGQNQHSLLARMLNDKDISRKDVFTMIMDMFLAGIDTVTFSAAFAFYNLSRNVLAQHELRKEVIQHLPLKTSRLDESVPKMDYLQLVMRETMRLNPPTIGTGRVIKDNLVLSGYQVPAGTNVLLQHQVTSKLEKYFDNPNKFDPGRDYSKSHPVIVSPFGYGSRSCIGQKIARTELHSVIARVVRNFKFTYHYGPVNSFNRLTNVPDKPIYLRFSSVE